MQLTSPVFRNNEYIPKKYTCEGLNVNPPLDFKDIPAETKSLVLLVEDPDATAKPWVHWLVYNIPPSAEGFVENAIPVGAIEGICNGGTMGYEGPCPDGSHQYLFKLYALDTRLYISKNGDRREVLSEMAGHVLAEAVLRGVYRRQEVLANPIMGGSELE